MTAGASPRPHGITWQDIKRCMDDLYGYPSQICGVHYPHLLDETVRGWTSCCTCGAALFVSEENGELRVQKA